MQSKRLIECMFYALLLLVVRERPVTGQCTTDLNCTSVDNNVCTSHNFETEMRHKLNRIQNTLQEQELAFKTEIQTEIQRSADKQEIKFKNITDILLLEQTVDIHEVMQKLADEKEFALKNITEISSIKQQLEIRRQTDEQILQNKNITGIALLKLQDKISTEMRRLADEQESKLKNITQMLEQLVSSTFQPRKINYFKLCK